MTKGRRVIAAVVGTATMALASAAPAAAATDYHPSPDARSFGTGAGGWAGETTNDGLICIGGVTCPTVTSEFVAADGAGGPTDGFLRTNVGGLASVLSTTESTFTARIEVVDVVTVNARGEVTRKDVYMNGKQSQAAFARAGIKR